jgi:hypothetical protein
MTKQSGANGGARVTRRGAATIFLAGCIVFSLLVLGGAKLSALRADVMSAYEGGETSILADLTKHNENAYNIITVGKRVLGAGDEAVTGAEAAYKAMNGASAPSEKYAADQELDSAITFLVSKLHDSGLNEKDKTLVNGQKADMDSRDMIISHSDYNARVTEYSNVISSFPGNIIALARGLGAPGYYR